MSDHRQIKPNIEHSGVASGIFAVMKIRRVVKRARLCLYVRGAKMSNGA